MTDTDFDLDDEPVLTAEAATTLSCSAATLSPPTCSTNPTAFIQEEVAALLEEKNAEIAHLRAIANCKFADADQMRLHHAGLQDKTFVFIAAHLTAQFKAIGASNYAQIEVNHEERSCSGG